MIFLKAISQKQRILEKDKRYNFRQLIIFKLYSEAMSYKLNIISDKWTIIKTHESYHKIHKSRK